MISYRTPPRGGGWGLDLRYVRDFGPILRYVSANVHNIGFIARDYTEVKPQKYLFPKNMPKQEFLFGKIEDEKIIIVEGVFDVMKTYAIYITNILDMSLHKLFNLY